MKIREITQENGQMAKWKYATKVYVVPEFAYIIPICPIMRIKSKGRSQEEHTKMINERYCHKDCDVHQLHLELECHNDLFCSLSDDEKTMQMITDMIERMFIGKHQPQLRSTLGLDQEGFAEKSEEEWKEVIKENKKECE